MHARAVGAAVLGPHHREDAELRDVRLAAEKLHDAVVFVALQPVSVEQLLIDHRTAAHLTAMAPTIDSKIMRPSTPPTSGSQARSGCGIMPTTLRRSLQMLAIACTEPFGFHASSTWPFGSV